MEKTIKIEGMMCPKCEARVKKALEAIDGIEEASPSHETGTAVIKVSGDVSDELIKSTVNDCGYTFAGIE